MEDQQREILNQVAAGAITAEEGAARLEELESDAAAAPGPTTTGTATEVKQIRILSRLGNTEVIGDPTVASAVAEGPHRAHQDGDTLVIEQSSPITEETSFEFSRPHRQVVINGFDLGRKMTVRVNPDLPLTANVQAGNLRVAHVHGDLTSDVQAGNCTVVDFQGALKLGVAAGNVAAFGRLDHGASSIRCDMGQVKLSLDPGSSVRVNARTTLGKVSFEGSRVKDGVVGSGAGTLDVECTMGNVRVTVE